MKVIECDVAVIGGGPGGSTLGTLLRKYAPGLRVCIFEREKFPRDHVGESQLPPIGEVLEEMGCWDAIEAADFPIKIGATFRWGKTADLWDFEFLPLEDFKHEQRPGKFVGQRRQVAFQVDRSIYDDVLLRHARNMGCEVHEETQVASVEREGDRVTGLVLSDGRRVTARYYVDASGHSGILRRALDIETYIPTALRNIAIYDYWENAKWAVEIGVGGTRIQILSKKNGWLWFIPLGPTRTSVGFVCPAEHYKQDGRTPEAIYMDAVQSDPRVSHLVEGGTRRGPVITTKDWSFVSARGYGENWFLVGEALGFADPILSAGLTLTHTGARELAYTIIALDRGELDRKWLLDHYESTQTRRLKQHIRFADFWYASNGQFTDLKENCRRIAADSGLKLTPHEAWRWLAVGGFANDFEGQAGIGGYSLTSMKQITQRFTNLPAKWSLNHYNVFKMAVLGAKESTVPIYIDGRIDVAKCYTRGVHRLVLCGMYKTVVDILQHHSDIRSMCESLRLSASNTMTPEHVEVAYQHFLQVLEVMVTDGWVTGKSDPRKSMLAVTTPNEGRMIHKNTETDATAKRPTKRRL